jgi:hypothetical protein
MAGISLRISKEFAKPTEPLRPGKGRKSVSEALLSLFDRTSPRFGSVKESDYFSIPYDFRGLARFVTVLSPVETKWASTRSRRRGAWRSKAKRVGRRERGHVEADDPPESTKFCALEAGAKFGDRLLAHIEDELCT